MIGVLDTNVWLDWLVFDDPSAKPLRAAHAAGWLRLASDADLRAELALVLARPLFALDEAGVAARLALHDDAVEPLDRLGTGEARGPLAMRCRDPDDQKFLEVAVAARATLLVTKDRALLALAKRARRDFGLDIVRPQAALL